MDAATLVYEGTASIDAPIDAPVVGAAERPGWWAIVAQMADAGASPHTIAAALNRSPWRSAGGKTWHWRHVAALLSPPEPRDRRAAARVERTGAAVLRSLEDEHTRTLDVTTRMALHLQAGESCGTIAARLNRSGSRTPQGTRWTERSVEAVLRPRVGGAFDRPVQLRAG
jgi:hypothetical protein